MIRKCIPIGEGGNWSVCEIECDPININGNQYSNIVLKKPKKNKNSIENYLRNYRDLISLNVPTLSFCEPASIYFDEFSNTKDAIICQNLNISFPKKIYGSGNTVKIFKDEEFRILLAELEGREYVTHITSKAEKYLIDNKFTCIYNFNSFITRSFDILDSIKSVLLTEDSFFFGVIYHDKTTIEIEDFIIADLDFPCKCKGDMRKQTKEAFLTALCEFCMNFEDGQQIYFKRLNNCFMTADRNLHN